ncbi:outer membrane protein assembly factor BamE [Candidatus Thioglobus autotrophicus]|uniref:outer membrane protein assembly factor BamE n=1 Tax=Candidatus Thioglobus autotrophicus TaxID=1705394 RepID=UPI0009E98414|nr:outer membrane protein assembly factor BamE [Candidatus Thioglobus autotrophicus]
MNKLTLIAFSFSLPFLSACTPSMPTLPDMPNILPDLSLPTLYKDDVQQGSVLTRFKINQLKVGMSTAQVQDLIGSPSVIDPFHNNQWNYVNHSTRHEQGDIHYRLVLKFEQNKLTLIDTTEIASLPELTDKEKALEEKRLTEAKVAIEAAKQAKIKAQELAKEKAEVEAQRIAAEKSEAEALKKKTELAQAKQPIKAKEVVSSQPSKTSEIAPVKHIKPKTINKKPQAPVPAPWYKFWMD